MKRILFSTYANTCAQREMCKGLYKLLQQENYQIDFDPDVNVEQANSYDLIIAFNKKGYERVKQLCSETPVIYSISMLDYPKEYIWDSTQYEHVLLVKANSITFSGGYVTPICFPFSVPEQKIEGSIRKQRKPVRLVVGMGANRTLLRTLFILNTLIDCKIDIITSEPEYYGGYTDSHITIHSEDEDGDVLIRAADIVIGNKYTALKGVLYGKPVVLAGDYGYGGLITRESVIEQYHNSFFGRQEGIKDEYFPLERLVRDIDKALVLTEKDILPIREHLLEEGRVNDKKILEIISFYTTLKEIDLTRLKLVKNSYIECVRLNDQDTYFVMDRINRKFLSSICPKEKEVMDSFSSPQDLASAHQAVKDIDMKEFSSMVDQFVANKMLVYEFS